MAEKAIPNKGWCNAIKKDGEPCGKNGKEQSESGNWYCGIHFKNHQKFEKEDEMKEKPSPGKGGGANTTKNGKKLEDNVQDIFTSNCSSIKTHPKDIPKDQVHKVQDVIIKGVELIRARKGALVRFYDNIYEGSCEEALHGAKEPDDCFINPNTKVFNWIECKAQGQGGSVCEKLQTYSPKIRNLRERYPDYYINYIYVLEPYFRESCPKEIENIMEDNIKIIWSDDENFEEKLLSVIV